MHIYITQIYSSRSDVVVVVVMGVYCGCRHLATHVQEMGEVFLLTFVALFSLSEL